MPVKLWAYNYNFEFDFAQQKSVNFGREQVLPWWFLNRCSTLLIPLTSRHDAILTYQIPQSTVLQQLQNCFDNLPQFIEITSVPKESNCIFDDFKQSKAFNKSYQKYSLSPWGWSPKAINLAEKSFKNTFVSNFQNTIFKANSKQTSDYIRSSLLPQSFRIPSLQIRNKEISLNTLRNEIYGFISQYPQVKIKHYFGASGRLSDTANELSIGPKKIRQWQSWIKHAGGILIEQKFDIEAEYSIQAELTKDGSVKVLILTQMFSNSNGSYLGNLISQSEQGKLPGLSESLNPLFSYLAEIGYQGPLGIDLLKTSDGEVKLIELNARYTMGRIAYEWDRAINTYPIGFFSNFFIKGSQTQDISAFSDFCRFLEKRFNCTISLINVIPSQQKPFSLVTIFIGANTKNLISKTLNEIYPVLFQSIRL